eukprot:5530195-Pyramimonas_sp.AAC.1
MLIVSTYLRWQLESTFEALTTNLLTHLRADVLCSAGRFRTGLDWTGLDCTELDWTVPLPSQA